MIQNITEWNDWKNRPIHIEKHFIEDGAVDIETWKAQNVKILYLMKEAYGEIHSLTKWLKKSGEKNSFGRAPTFPNLIRWSDAITQANQDNSLNFQSQYDSSDINRIAVVNLKKSAGENISNYLDLEKYVMSDWDLLEEQIMSLRPDFVVCCGTFDLIKSKIQYTKDEQGCRYNKLKWKSHHEPYIINFIHPASRGMKHSHMYYLY